MKTLLLLALLLPFQIIAQTEDLAVIEVEDTEESSLVDLDPPTTQLKEKDLLKRREVTLGETLRHESGIQSTGFGPNASRPVVRGLEGDRIRILQNGLGTLDASSQSVDHAIPVDTLTVDKIEVIRGPTGLLYGSSVIGGVINIVNNRIHRELSPGLINQLDLRSETVNNGLSGSGRIDYGVSKWLFHLDGSYQNLSDQHIPGKARSKKQRSIDPQNDEAMDRLKNSENQQSSGSIGASRIFKQGHLGFSYYRFDNSYGTVADPNVDIQMQQNRIEMSSEFRPKNSQIKKISLRSAQSFYKHEELEGEEIGTTFRNQGNESRLEIVSKKGKLKGVSGVQTQLSTFRAAGDEAFLPTSKNTIASLFTLQEYLLSPQGTFQVGGRLENTQIKKESSLTFGPSDEKSFTGINASTGYLHKFNKILSSSLSLSYTERAPTFQELFADGEHVATSTFETGDSSLTKEKAHAFEFSLKKDRPDSSLTVSGFVQQIQDFVVLSPLGTFSTGPEVADFEYIQDRALLYGGEVDSHQEVVHEMWGGAWWLNGRADIVIGKNQSSGNYLPRMPAPRITVGLEFIKDSFNADVEVERYFEQHRTALNELRTEAFYLANFGLLYEIPREARNLRLYFRVKNIFDQEARLHTSYLKEVAPLAGRNFLAGVQVLF